MAASNPPSASVMGPPSAGAARNAGGLSAASVPAQAQAKNNAGVKRTAQAAFEGQ